MQNCLRFIVVTTIVCSSLIAVSNSYARQIIEIDGLHATVDHNFSCAQEVSINVESTDANAFKGDRIGLQKLLGGVRAALGFECDSIIKRFNIVGKVKEKSVYQAYIQDQNNWRLTNEVLTEAKPAPETTTIASRISSSRPPKKEILSENKARDTVSDALQRQLRVDNMKAGPYIAAIYSGDFDKVNMAMKHGVLLDISLIHQAYIVGYENYHASCLTNSNSVTLEAQVRSGGSLDSATYRMKKRLEPRFRQYFEAGDYGLAGMDGAAALFGIKTPRAEVIDFVSSHSCSGPTLTHFEENLYRAANGLEPASRPSTKPGDVSSNQTATASGLIFTDIIKGSGESFVPGQKAVVNFLVLTEDGDVTYKTDTKHYLMIHQVDPCFAEGLQMMSAGGRSRMICKPTKDSQTNTVVYEVELLQIIPQQ